MTVPPRVCAGGAVPPPDAPDPSAPRRPVAELAVMGCRLNHAEAARVRGALEAAGWDVAEAAGAPSGAGAFVLHTCAVTGAAEREAFRHVRAARRAGCSPVVVSGCAASVAAEEAWRAAGADAALSRRAAPLPPPAPGAPVAERLAFLVDAALRAPSAPPLHVSVRAPVKVQDGCSFRCSYCIVPDARGLPRSRPEAETLAECRALVARGFRELVLAGVNVACWRDGGRTFPDLLRAVAALPGLARVRVSSVEPGTEERGVADAIAESGGRICPFLHLPLQSGSDRTLRAMRRRRNAAECRESIEHALSRIPRLGLGADFITGFPGETDADFDETMRLVRDYPFSNLHVFPYSERPGTPAAAMPGAVPVRVRRERARALAALGEEKRRAFAASFAGGEAEVLVERVGPDGVATGWSGEYLRVAVPGRSDADIGALLRVRVLRAEADALLAP